MDTSEPVNNLDSHVLHHQEEEEEEVQDKEEVGQIYEELIIEWNPVDKRCKFW